MRNKVIIVILICILVFGVMLLNPFGRKPFKGLVQEEILLASVTIIPPNKSVEIIDTEELVECLQEIVTYNKDDTYKEYSGQAVTFTLSMSNGSEIEIMEYNPFIVIDGISYKTKYEPCEKLNSYANNLLTESE